MKGSKLKVFTHATGFNLVCDSIHFEFDGYCILLVSNYDGLNLGIIELNKEDIDSLKKFIEENNGS